MGKAAEKVAGKAAEKIADKADDEDKYPRKEDATKSQGRQKEKAAA